MATVVNVPAQQTQRLGGSVGGALGTVGGLLLAAMIKGRSDRRKREEEEAALKRASQMFTRALSGEPQFVGPPSGAAITPEGPIPGRKPELEEAPDEGAVLGAMLEAGIGESTALAATRDVTRARQERQENQQMEAAFSQLAESLPEGPGRDLALSLIQSRVAQKQPGFASTLLQTFQQGAKAQKTPERLGREAEEKEAGRLRARKAAGIKEGAAKPTETDKRISAVLQGRGLESTPENLSKARIMVARADKVRTSLGKRLQQNQETGLFDSPRNNVLFNIAEGKVEDILMGEGDKSVGKVADQALNEAEDDLRTGKFLPEGQQPGQPGFGVDNTARFLKGRFNMNREEILDVLMEMSRSLKLPLSREDAAAILEEEGIR